MAKDPEKSIEPLSSEPVRQFDAQALASPIDSKDRFRTIRLEDHGGEFEFRIGTVSQDVSFTHSRCLVEKDYRADIEYHEATTLLIFGLRGYSDFRSGGTSEACQVRAGDVWYLRLNPGVLHRITPAQQTSEMVVIKYTGRRLADALGGAPAQFSLEQVRVQRLGRQIDADAGIDALLNNLLVSASDRLLAESQALQLLARWIAPSRQALQSLLEPAQGRLREPEQAMMARIVKILTSDPACPPSLRQLAQLANMSHARLNRCFKSAYGTTVYSWLRRYRLTQSRHHLAEQNLSITEIAFRFGFSSASHFASLFKKEYGCSPGVYRARLTQ